MNVEWNKKNITTERKRPLNYLHELMQSKTTD